MGRTDWDGLHSALHGLTDEGKMMGKEIIGKDAPSAHEVLKAAWQAQDEDTSVAAFSRSELVQLLFPGASERAIDTRISKVIKAELEAEKEQEVEEEQTVNLFATHNCELERTHVAIQSGRTYREPVLVRVSSQKRAPYDVVEVGDQVFMKASGGPILRHSTVRQVDTFSDAHEQTEEILELVEGTELENDPDFLSYITETTASGNPKNYCTVVLFEPWEDLQQRVTVHPPRGVGASWVVINSERKIDRYLVGEAQVPKRQKQREAILRKHQGKEKSNE
jgi:hypothetical protein